MLEIEGDRATGIRELDLRTVVDGVAMTGFGYYRDEYVRVDSAWKFMKRALQMERCVPDASGARDS